MEKTMDERQCVDHDDDDVDIAIGIDKSNVVWGGCLNSNGSL